MKALSIIFTILGTIVTAISFFANYAAYQYYGILWIGYVSLFIDVIFTILVCWSISNESKYTFIGVITLIFVSLLGGIFYLCWKPEVETSSEESDLTYSASRREDPTKTLIDLNNQELEIMEQMKKYKDFHEQNIISDVEYEKKYNDLKSELDRIKENKNVKPKKTNVSFEEKGKWICECGMANYGGLYCMGCYKTRKQSNTEKKLNFSTDLDNNDSKDKNYKWICECGMTNYGGDYCTSCYKPRKEN